MGNNTKEDKGLTTTSDMEKTFGWKGFDFKAEKGLLALMQDGDQQLLNPYGPKTSKWTMYSFRPYDIAAGFP